MSYFQIVELIQRGNYQLAFENIDILIEKQSSVGLALKSRILELNGNFKEALQFSELAIITSENKKDYIGKLEAIIAKSYSLWRLFRFKEAHEAVKSGKQVLSDVLDQEREIILNLKSSLLNIQGLIRWKENQLEEALSIFMSSLKIRKQLKNFLAISYSLNNLGNTILKMGELYQAFNYFKEGYIIRVKLGYKPAIAASLNSFGRYYDEKVDFDRALLYHIKSLELWEIIGNKQFIGKSNRFLANNYYLQKNYPLANEFYQKALNSFETINNEIDTNITLSEMNRIP